MSDLEIIKAARRSAHAYGSHRMAAETADSDEAAITAYQADALGDQRDLWDAQQELLYRMAFAEQLRALGF